MDDLWLRLLQGLLAFAGVCHLAIGGGIMLSPAFQDWAAKLYGATVDWTPPLRYILRPLGAFMVALGGLGVAAAFDPLAHPEIVYAFVALLLIRDVQRLLLRRELYAAFRISPRKNLITGGFFLAIAVGLVALLQLASR